MPRRPARILIRGANWIGDAMMTIPAMRELRRLFPESRITLLVNDPLHELFQAFSAVDHVMGFCCRGGPGGVVDRLALVGELRRARFDLCLILPNSFDSALIPFLAGIPARVGFSRDGRGFLLTHPVPPARSIGEKHQAHHYLKLVSVLGPTEGALHFDLEVDATAHAWAEERLASLRKGGHRTLIGLNPGAAYGPAKRWFPDRFSDLGRRLAADLDAGLIVVGGPGEKALGASVAGTIGTRVLDLSGETTLPQLAAVLAGCDLLVTNDSGPMHLASAVGVPVVVVFGPTDPEATGPMGRHRIARKACPCAPCLERTCPRGDSLCMSLVEVEEVLQAVEELLAESERPHRATW